MHTCISYQSCACMHHNDLYFMHVNMHIHISLCVYMIHIYIYLSAHICVYIFIHTLHAWMYMYMQCIADHMRQLVRRLRPAVLAISYIRTCTSHTWGCVCTRYSYTPRGVDEGRDERQKERKAGSQRAAWGSKKRCRAHQSTCTH